MTVAVGWVERTVLYVGGTAGVTHLRDGFVFRPI